MQLSAPAKVRAGRWRPGLDDDPGMKAADHIFVANKCEWHDITDNLPVFKEGPAAVIETGNRTLSTIQRDLTTV